jgi:hypothetical protein
MSADNKTGLAPGDASEIEDVTRNAGHDAEGEMTNSGDAWKEPDIGSVNIEKVANLQSFAPPVRSLTKILRRSRSGSVSLATR